MLRTSQTKASIVYSLDSLLFCFRPNSTPRPTKLRNEAKAPEASSLRVYDFMKPDTDADHRREPNGKVTSPTPDRLAILCPRRGHIKRLCGGPLRSVYGINDHCGTRYHGRKTVMDTHVSRARSRKKEIESPISEHRIRGGSPKGRPVASRDELSS